MRCEEGNEEKLTINILLSLTKNTSRQEYWSGLLCPPPGDLSDPDIKLKSPALQADSLLPEPPGKPKGIACGNKLSIASPLPIETASICQNL